jgi:hypothetical protein
MAVEERLKSTDFIDKLVTRLVKQSITALKRCAYCSRFLEELDGHDYQGFCDEECAERYALDPYEYHSSDVQDCVL